jgi:hypothetical protein
MPILIAIVVVVAIWAGWTAVLMLVWNAVAAALGLPLLTFWLTAGISFLIGCVGSCFRTPRVVKT